MHQTKLQRKLRIAYLNVKILVLKILMDQEAGVTDLWKAQARQLSRLINERNQLRTLEDIRKIEERRGL
ncbi:hypothetical protein [Marinobacter sp.]|uniref:hypothetical protein n=1 Tax=Marinobacter sp. TaxID=50741 RepID=UPI0035654039